MSTNDIETNVPPQPKRRFERKMSKSEEAEEGSSGRFQPPAFIRWIEVPFRVTDPTSGKQLREATGWAMDASARGPLNSAGTFVGSALLRLAVVDAGGPTSTIYGFKPSSLLSLFSAITGVVAAILMPYVGAIVDHTSLRKQVGIITGIILVGVTMAQIWISIDNWFIMLILEAVGGFMLLVHFATVLAYLPDLTTNDDDVAHYTSRFNLRQFTMQSSYVACVVIISQIRDIKNPLESTIQTAKDSAGIAFGFAAFFLSYAWMFCFRKRGPLHVIPEGDSIVTTGFKKVKNTSSLIWRKYHTLKWFMISMLWSPEAGAGVVLTIAVTYLTIYIKLDGKSIGYVNLTMLVCNIPGSYFAKFMCDKINPLNSYRLALLFFATVAAGTFAHLDGPDKADWIYMWAVFWGIAYGWTYPSQRVLICTLIPKGQEAEMMGLFTFTGQVLGWLIPLIFTIMNEKGVNIRWSCSIISFFVMFAFICTLPMGTYESGLNEVQEAEDDEELNGMAVEKSTSADDCGSSSAHEETQELEKSKF
mmetsp:Transcript_4304/g.6152  ORF Transcript_4304/g.6152 Transcript_4304/m.6152 type:complete len:532 (-) Transcript_4304:2332-3927(-)